MAGKSAKSNNRGSDLFGYFVSGKHLEYHTQESANRFVERGLTATGGIINDYTVGSDVYRTHVFNQSGALVVSDVATGNLPNAAEYLVVAGGGGGGGGYYAGGGGAGGVRTNLPGHPLATGNPTWTIPGGGTYPITIGAGGYGGATDLTSPHSDVGDDGTNGANTSLTIAVGVTTITAHGGGAGRGRSSSAIAGIAGGSGGGTAYGPPGAGGFGLNPTTPTAALTPFATYQPGTTEGNPGGSNPDANYYGSGGGGAGGAGSGGPFGGPYGYPGGDGIQVLIAGPTTTGIGSTGASSDYGYFAGGGGGGGPDATNVGGSGGGGGGAIPTRRGFAGWPGTGSGGGGGTIGYGGANGGAGVVVVRYKIATLAASAKATGGLISFYNNKTIHTFLASGTFTVTDSTLTSIETVIVAGGGGGGGTKSTGSYTGAGGGGAGGVYVNNSMTVSSTGGPQSDGAYPLTVGAGGQGGYEDNTTSYNAASGQNGGQSIFNSITINGGGGGGPGANNSAPFAGSPGASGGGQGGYDATASVTNATAGPFPGTLSNSPTAGFGHPAGDEDGYNGSSGGGAGAKGPNANTPFDGSVPTSSNNFRGGCGIQLPASFRDPASTVGAPGPITPAVTGADTSGKYYVGGGGGGGGYDADSGQYGGFGGGGAGGFRYPGSTLADAAQPASQNTGGGGGGARIDNPNEGAGGNGGSGIILIAYPT